MDRETLRQAVLDGDDRIIGSPAWRFFTDEQKRLMKAGRAFWAKNDPVTDAALDDMVALFNQSTLTEEEKA